MEGNSSSFITFIVTLPVLLLAAGGVLAMLLDAFGYLKSDFSKTVFSVFVLFSALCFLQPLFVINELVLSRQVVGDSFAGVFSCLILLASIAVVLINHSTLDSQGVEKSRDLYPLMLFSIAGAVGLVSSNNLIGLFICIELLSIPVYVMAASVPAEKASAEGALKYFILGAVSSAFLLYGLALLYASTGSLDIQIINNVLVATHLVTSPLLLLAGALLIFGFAFKLSLAPFHFWTPDAYQGAPLGINSYMSVVVKAAAFGGLIRIFSQCLPTLAVDFRGLFIVLGVVSMIVGNLSAMRQTSIKRLFAYSSIAHAGYAVVCIPLLSIVGQSAVITYVIFYSLATLGIYAVLVGHLAGTPYQYQDDDLSRLRGMSKRDPIAAVLFAIFVLSLAGIPPLAGFFGKFYLISALVKSHYVGLAVILVLNSALSLFYYLKVIALVFEPGEELSQSSYSTFPGRLVSVFSGVVVVSSVFLLDFVSTQSHSAVDSLGVQSVSTTVK